MAIQGGSETSLAWDCPERLAFAASPNEQEGSLGQSPKMPGQTRLIRRYHVVIAERCPQTDVPVRAGS